MSGCQTHIRAGLLLVMAICATARSAEDTAPWHDGFYQYRLPITAATDAAGWHVLPLDESQITAAINAIEQMKYDERFFAYPALRLVAIDEQGKSLEDVEGGFYLIRRGEELAGKALSSADADGTCMITVTPERYHLMTYTNSGGGRSPAVHYEPIWPPDSPRHSGFAITYEPPLLPLARTTRQVLFMPSGDQMKLQVGGRFIGKLHGLSVRAADIRFLVNVPRAGTHRWMLYYQPMCGHHLQMPSKHAPRLPQQAAVVKQLGAAEKDFGRTQYRLHEVDGLQISFAESTVKITRDLPVPDVSASQIDITLAANEAQSFQLLLNARKPMRIDAVTVKQPRSDHGTLTGTVRMVEYVPIRRSSDITPARYLGEIGDPLIPVAPRTLSARSGHQAYWITVRAPAGTRPGIYQGAVLVQRDGREIQLPLSVRVYDFELPEHSAFKANLGGAFFAKTMGADSKTVLDYHGLKTKDDLKTLARAYYELMVDNRFSPKNVALYETIDMTWTPPPKGYNVNAPDNFFELKDWNFAEFNAALRHAIDEKHLNSICILHTNPTACNIFTQLPGEALESLYLTPPHVTYAWQTFRQTTLVSYDPPPPGDDSIIQVTRAQWDDLVKKFFRRIAENLEENGWLDKTHILVDETEHPERLVHFLRLLKSDPLTARIQVVACVQGLGLLTERTGSASTRAGRPLFHQLIDTFCPEVDENYDRWMDYYFDDYDLSRQRKRLWFYAVSSARLAIDAPGINNRMIALDVFRRGGSGYLVWETFAWDHLYGESKNPWVDPWTRHANGSLAYFYPPCRTGPCDEPDFTITPSLRVETFRESVEDFDYAWLLEQAVKRGIEEGRDVSEARAVLVDISRFFEGNVHWSQNDAWYLELRERMARAIEALATPE